MGQSWLATTLKIHAIGNDNDPPGRGGGTIAIFERTSRFHIAAVVTTGDTSGICNGLESRVNDMCTRLIHTMRNVLLTTTLNIHGRRRRRKNRKNTLAQPLRYASFLSETT